MYRSTQENLRKFKRKRKLWKVYVAHQMQQRHAIECLEEQWASHSLITQHLIHSCQPFVWILQLSHQPRQIVQPFKRLFQSFNMCRTTIKHVNGSKIPLQIQDRVDLVQDDKGKYQVQLKASVEIWNLSFDMCRIIRTRNIRFGCYATRGNIMFKKALLCKSENKAWQALTQVYKMSKDLQLG